MQRFTELRIWQRSHRFVIDVYRVTQTFPDDERFGLVSQIRRAAISIPANIAEGAKRRSRSEYVRFLNVAEASLAESESLLFLSRDLAFLEVSEAEVLIHEAEEISRMLSAMRKRVSSAPDD